LESGETDGSAIQRERENFFQSVLLFSLFTVVEKGGEKGMMGWFVIYNRAALG